ncbi:hypothetical protein HKX48_000004 [Thoreauomyces humboldtii]|nr:hypothetical protein HKX48_000004 [Thoreauomyces humboldtii]
MGSMWIVITGLQTEYRYKVGMLLLYLIGFRLVFRTAFCSELFTQDFGSTVQIFLSTAYIPTIRARERMNKESYSSHRPSRNELAFDPSSIDSLHEQQPSLIPTRGIRSRTRAGLIKYWRFFQDQTFKDPGKEVAFRIYFSKALVTDTRLMYMFACGSSMASTATLLVTYGTTESVAAPAFGYLAYFIPASCIFGFITTFIPPLGPLYPARQQSMALFLYTVLCVMSIFATNLVISTIVTSEVAFDVYLGFSCFRLSIMMARASAPTFRTRYALVAFLIDALSTLYASMTARKLQHGMVVATLFLTVTLMAGFVISPWGEKAHRRYCRTVVWSGTVGAGKRKMKLESKMDEREKGEGEGEPEREVVLRSLEAGDV